MKRTLLLTVALLAATPCHSAEITIYRGEIIVTGRIEQDDYEKFLGTAAGMVDGKKQTVRISSPGGHMNPAIRIGKFIREQGWKTFVPEFGHCASACLLIWAAGLPRLFGHGAILGAHCVTTLENPTQCYEPGNVRYREFLRSMEMPEEFIELRRKTTLPIVWVPLDTAANATVLPQNRNPK